MTVKELSEVCNVSTQSIRNYCKRNNLPKQRNKQGKPTYIIDEETEKAIICYFNADENKDTNQTNKDTNESNKVTKQRNKLENVSENKFETILDTFTKQLEIKDKQIQDLTEQNKKLLDMVKTLTEQNSKQAQLTEQAHTLHYIDIAKPDSEPQQTAQRTQQQQAHKPQQAKTKPETKPQERKPKPKENIFDSILKRFRK